MRWQIVLLFYFAAVTSSAVNNCDSGVDIPRDNVNITDQLFQTISVKQNSSYFITDIQYFPEQVLPFGFRSSVFLYVTGDNARKWPNFTGSEKQSCAFEFDFLSGNRSHFTTLAIPKLCFTMLEVSNRKMAFLTDMEYYYCLGTKEACDRVTATALGFKKDSRVSLRTKALCTRVTYKLVITISQGAPLDQVNSFALEYIRDPIRPVEQFFDRNGDPVILRNDILWAVCDQDDLLEFDYKKCFQRLAIDPEPRVLSLSSPVASNNFALVFSLGEQDVPLVSSSAPLTIIPENSEVWLFHALYSGNEFYSCAPPLCTKVTSEAEIQVGTFGRDPDVPNHWSVRVEGNMPRVNVGSQVADMQCDVSFCTLVWVFNFRAVQQSRRLHTLPWNRERETNSVQQVSATQERVVKVFFSENRTIVHAENENLVVIAGSVGGGLGILSIAAIFHWRRRLKKPLKVNSSSCDTEQ